MLQLFDNTAFHARTCEGGLIPCRKEPLSGTYPIDGDLVVQPVEALESVLNDSLPILEAWGTIRSSLWSPLPRYITPGSCDDPEHAASRSAAGLFLRQLPGEDEEAAEGLSHAACQVIKPLWLLGGPTKLPSADILDLIAEGWGTDPVHPIPRHQQAHRGYPADPAITGSPGQPVSLKAPDRRLSGMAKVPCDQKQKQQFQLLIRP